MLDKFLPPTDNLYKFTAIAGLLIIGFSFVPNYYSFKFGELVIESRKKNNILLVETLYDKEKNDEERKEAEAGKQKLEEKIQQAELNLKKLEENVQKIKDELRENGVDPDKIQTRASETKTTNTADVDTANKLKEEKAKLNKIREDTKNTKIKYEETKSEAELMDFYETMLSYAQILSGFLFILGLFITFVGFYFWYIKLQKPNDVVLLSQIKEKGALVKSKGKKKRFF